jgi:hypothetical protein
LPGIRPSPALVLFLLSPTVDELLSGSSPPAKFFTPFGFTIMTALYGGGAVFWVLPGIQSPLLHPVIVMALGALLDVLLICRLASYDWRRSTDLHRFAVVAGSLSLFIAFAFLQELDRTRTDNRVGMSLVGLSFLVGLALLGMKVRGRSEWRGP